MTRLYRPPRLVTHEPSGSRTRLSLVPVVDEHESACGEDSDGAALLPFGRRGRGVRQAEQPHQGATRADAAEDGDAALGVTAADRADDHSTPRCRKLTKRPASPSTR